MIGVTGHVDLTAGSVPLVWGATRGGWTADVVLEARAAGVPGDVVRPEVAPRGIQGGRVVHGGAAGSDNAPEGTGVPMRWTRWVAMGLALLADSRDIGHELKRHPERVMTERDRTWRAEEQDDATRELRLTAVWRRRNWKAADAVQPYEQLVAVRTAAWGADHPLVLDTRLGLAAVRAEAGDVAGAAREYEQLLGDMLRVLGADHPRIAWVRRNLAHWRGRRAWVAPPLPRTDELEGPVRDEVTYRERPDTAVHGRLAQVRWRQGDEVGAVEAYETLLRERVRHRGADDAVTLVTRLTLADMRAQAGDVAGALAAYESLLGDMVRLLGVDHRGTRWTREQMKKWRGEPGRAS